MKTLSMICSGILLATLVVSGLGQTVGKPSGAFQEASGGRIGLSRRMCSKHHSSIANCHPDLGVHGFFANFFSQTTLDGSTA
jgi:hypothetical protein